MSTSALVIIDVQNAILDFPDLPRRDLALRALDAAVERMAAALRRARAEGIPVIFVQHAGGPGHRLERGTRGWEIRAELSPRAEEPVVHKTAPDSFLETNLAALLEARRVDRLIVAGCRTEYCVDTTVRRAASQGYDVTLIADGHMTADSATLRFEEIIAHHNELLDGFDAGRRSVSVVPLASLRLAS